MNATMQDVATRPFSQRLLDTLRAFVDRGRDRIELDLRSLHGVGHCQLSLPAPLTAIPLPLLDALADGWSVRISPARVSGNPLDLGAAFVCWRPETRFDRETGWRYVVVPEAQARIREALAAFPLPPAQLIDAGPEVVALWPLDAPLAVDRDQARAIALLVGLAERLGADVATAQDLATTLPLCGVIRSWNNAGELIDIVDVEPGRRYRIEELEAALANPQPAEAVTLRRMKGASA